MVRETGEVSEQVDSTSKYISLAFFGTYFCFFLGIGILLPYIFVFLRATRGMSELLVGIAALLAPLSVMVAQPLWGTLSDLTGRPVLIIQLASLAGGGSALLMWMNLHFGWYFLLVPLFFTFQSAVNPLVNAAVVHREEAAGEQGEFGQKRLWGSLGFVFGNIIGAQATHFYGLAVIFPLYAGVMVLLAFQAYMLVGIKMQPVSFREMLQGVKRAVNRPTFRWLLIFLILWGIPFGGNSVAFGWFWKDLGGSNQEIGYLWLLAAIFEIPLYYLTVHYKEKISFRVLLLVSASAAGLRWFIYIIAPFRELLFFVQPLHAVMFVSLSVGAVYLIDSLSDPVIRSTGQGLLMAAVYGLGSAIGNFSAGSIYHSGGPYIFYSFLIFCNFLCVLVILVKVKKSHLLASQNC